MKRNNIFGIDPKQQGTALQKIVGEIIRVLQNKNQDESKVEIEIKYAEFKYFAPVPYQQYISKIPDQRQQQKFKPMVDMIDQSRFYSKQNLRKLSRQNMIALNDLGRHIYCLNSRFDEPRYRKFYHMEEFLIRQCEFNENFLKKNILLPSQPKNIYHQYSQFGDNIKFQMQAKAQIRFDVIFKDPSSQLNGRYSYSNLTKSWIKTKKTSLLKEQIDLMLNEKTFRFAINNEDESEVSYQDLVALKEQLIKRKFKQIDIRLKKTLKCTKAGLVEYSLSQVYEPLKVQSGISIFEDLQQYISEDSDILDVYLIGKFQHFYDFKRPQELQDPTRIQSRFEVQCEFTKQGIRNLKDYIEKRQFRDIHYEIQQTIDSLYNLFYADHSVRTQEAPWMDKIMTKNGDYQKLVFPNQRLVNEFGSYMHNVMYEEMTKLKNV